MSCQSHFPGHPIIINERRDGTRPQWGRLLQTRFEEVNHSLSCKFFPSSYPGLPSLDCKCPASGTSCSAQPASYSPSPVICSLLAFPRILAGCPTQFSLHFFHMASDVGCLATGTAFPAGNTSDWLDTSSISPVVVAEEAVWLASSFGHQCSNFCPCLFEAFSDWIHLDPHVVWCRCNIHSSFFF